MKKLVLIAATLLVASTANAKLPLVKKAQKLGFDYVKDCTACHTAETPTAKDLTDMGKWLVAQKNAKKAEEVDVAWLKDYKAKKK